MIKAARIDHRLVHGQVAFSWSSFLGISRIIVIDDSAANNEMQKMVLKMSKPTGIKLNIFTVEQVLSRMEKVEKLTDTIFLIFGCTKDASRFIQGYPKIESLNLGGIAKKDGSKQYSPVIYLTDEELADVKIIADLGVEIFMQQLPTTKKEAFKFD